MFIQLLSVQILAGVLLFKSIKRPNKILQRVQLLDIPASIFCQPAAIIALLIFTSDWFWFVVS